ncbi:MAG: RdgB/HAM1 family non-canonical purine NTP pyrophosphatase [Firmicutes bacterium]|nr:RdgB/HAM1 family non-canonical purine NTP pyrophosphatase [Bacillota bacterium]
MKKILIASKNQGKINEYKEMLKPLQIEVISLLDLNSSLDVEETGTSFFENALLKAKSAWNQYHLPCIADDSGLEVEALHGEPGIYSQRYSPLQTDEANNLFLLEKLKYVRNRNARFVCQIVYYKDLNHYSTYEGILKGNILKKGIFQNGFGYDPYFYIPTLEKTLSQCTIKEKNDVSHRGLAMKNLLINLQKETV